MSLQDLLDTALPMNRKERFFTGTVLPMVVCADDFAHFHRFLKLVGAPDVPVISDPGSTNVQLFTEYGFAESLIGATRFPTVPAGRDTPDVVVLIRGEQSVLIAVEAKMFHRPTRAEFNEQLQTQRRLIDAIAYDLPDDVEVRHVALMPAQLQDSVGELAADTVTWQQVVEDFHDVAPPYWVAILRLALEGYEAYAGPEATFGRNADARMRGADILRLHRSRDLQYSWMGRTGGLHAPAIAEDISTGRWRIQPYEVRRYPLQGNPNWFLVRDFITILERDVPADIGPWTVEDLMDAWSAGALSFSDLVLRLTAVKLEPAEDPSYDDPSGIPGPNHFYPVSASHALGKLADSQYARLTRLWQPAAHTWAVSLVLIAWPEKADWVGSLVHHFDNWTMRDPLVCLDFIASWSVQGRNGQLPLYGVGVPVEVHGFVGVQGEHGFAPVAQWTPQLLYGPETTDPGPSREDAENELRRFQAGPRRFRPDRSTWGTAEGYWNKLHINRGLGSGWYIERLIDQAYTPGEQ